ncbi:MAG TPA: SGNH/GDSL hydrolase family protein [Candidatus Krumholzibacteria bacterium]
MSATPVTRKPHRRKRIGLYLAMLVVAGVVALGLAELALRLFPIPGIIFHNFYYDELTGSRFVPNSALMFRGDDGVLIRRSVNSWGFPDVRHDMQAPPGTLRIGFFGDSYVEALQVPIEKTFFRLIEDDLDLRARDLANLETRDGHAINGVETIAFGTSGRGALQSYLECGRWMEPLDLDYVVYVFVENDPADQVRELKGHVAVPYPVVSGDSFVVDDAYIREYAYKASWWHRAMQRIKSNSLVVSTIEGRLKLLKAHGVKRTVTPADRAGVGAGSTPMATSQWPPELVPTGWELQVRVMDTWRRQVEAQGRKFVILRVPRGNEVLRTPMAEQDTWAARLTDYCKERGVPLVDPTPRFVERMDAGETMYHDHFTPEGHRAFAQAFVDYLLRDAAAE